jgi:hypothetical protein
MTTVVCKDHECRFNNYHEIGSKPENECQFLKIFIRDGKCEKREVV